MKQIIDKAELRNPPKSPFTKGGLVKDECFMKGHSLYSPFEKGGKGDLYER